MPKSIVLIIYFFQKKMDFFLAHLWKHQVFLHIFQQVFNLFARIVMSKLFNQSRQLVKMENVKIHHNLFIFSIVMMVLIYKATLRNI